MSDFNRIRTWCEFDMGAMHELALIEYDAREEAVAIVGKLAFGPDFEGKTADRHLDELRTVIQDYTDIADTTYYCLKNGAQPYMIRIRGEWVHNPKYYDRV